MPHQYIPKQVIICPTCGKQFEAAPSLKRKYCSWECTKHGYAPRPLAERFWEKVDKNGPVPARYPELGPCWIWTSTKYPNGYGQISLGRGAGVKPAHRVAWELTNGPIPDGLWVLHKCDTPLCVNSAHHFLGTHQDNMDDMHRKGRGAPGEQHPLRLHPEQSAHGERMPQAKLTNDQARAIRDRYALGGISQRELARQYGVNPSQISRLVRGERWKHIA